MVWRAERRVLSRVRGAKAKHDKQNNDIYSARLHLVSRSALVIGALRCAPLHFTHQTPSPPSTTTLKIMGTDEVNFKNVGFIKVYVMALSDDCRTSLDSIPIVFNVHCQEIQYFVPHWTYLLRKTWLQSDCKVHFKLSAL